MRVSHNDFDKYFAEDFRDLSKVQKRPKIAILRNWPKSQFRPLQNFVNFTNFFWSQFYVSLACVNFVDFNFYVSFLSIVFFLSNKVLPRSKKSILIFVLPRFFQKPFIPVLNFYNRDNWLVRTQLLSVQGLNTFVQCMGGGDKYNKN